MPAISCGAAAFACLSSCADGGGVCVITGLGPSACRCVLPLSTDAAIRSAQGGVRTPPNPPSPRWRPRPLPSLPPLPPSPSLPSPRSPIALSPLTSPFPQGRRGAPSPLRTQAPFRHRRPAHRRCTPTPPQPSTLPALLLLHLVPDRPPHRPAPPRRWHTQRPYRPHRRPCQRQRRRRPTRTTVAALSFRVEQRPRGVLYTASSRFEPSSPSRGAAACRGPVEPLWGRTTASRRAKPRPTTKCRASRSGVGAPGVHITDCDALMPGASAKSDQSANGTHGDRPGERGTSARMAACGWGRAQPSIHIQLQGPLASMAPQRAAPGQRSRFSARDHRAPEHRR